MHIRELILHTRHVAAQQAFYCTTLGLPLQTETSDSFTVQAGETRLHFQETARSFYVCDPAGNILEYIVHYGLNHETEGILDTPPVLHVSEIGLPAEDVPAFADRLHKQLAIEPYGGSISENFACLGDIVGQLGVSPIRASHCFEQSRLFSE